MRAPKNALHPGEFLKFYIEDLQLSQSALSEKLGCKPAKVNEICTGKRGITAEFALALSKALGTTPEMWVQAQAYWELSEAIKKQEMLQSQKPKKSVPPITGSGRA